MTKCNKSVYLANKSIDMIDAVNKGYADGYNKAIDDLRNKICMHFADWKYSEDDKWIKDIIELASESVEEIAEQLKAGVKYDKEKRM